jgi:small subunit ribosomal protein S7
MRKNRAEKREILSDPIYNSQEVAKLINMIMWDGKKGLAQKIVYSALEKAAEKTKKVPIELFLQALENIGPTIELKVRRIAGANYQIPTPVEESRRKILALR